MQKLSESDRMLKKCACVITQVVDALPLLLSRIEPEVAAQIIATLARSVVTTTSLKIVPPEEGPAEALAKFVKTVKERCENRDIDRGPN